MALATERRGDFIFSSVLIVLAVRKGLFINIWLMAKYPRKNELTILIWPWAMEIGTFYFK